MSSEPLLFSEDLRVDVDGVPACDGLTLQTSGQHVVLLGAPHAFFEALTGQRPVVRGALRIQGIASSDAIARGKVAGAPLDPPLPPKWTALEYVTWSARLAGQPRSAARTLAKESLARVQLDPLAKQPLVRHVQHARRAVVVAAALATAAEVLVLEDPTSGLPEETAYTWASLLVSALGERPWLVLAGRLALTSSIALGADEALIVTGARLDAQGPPAELATAHRFVARLTSSGPEAQAALSERLAERGGRMDARGAQVLLDLGESLTTAQLLGLAIESNVTIVELLPLARALS